MNEKFSALMDGELDDGSAAEVIETLARDPEALHAWRTYHLISDAMRESRVLSEGFSARVSARLASEPTVLAPQRPPAEGRRWYALSAAASLAAVALVGWLAFAPQHPAAPVPAPLAESKAPVLVPMPSAANDYLLAHQGFSPRIFLQGMAPYVRTVAEHPQEARR